LSRSHRQTIRISTSQVFRGDACIQTSASRCNAISTSRARAEKTWAANTTSLMRFSLACSESARLTQACRRVFWMLGNPALMMISTLTINPTCHRSWVTSLTLTRRLSHSYSRMKRGVESSLTTAPQDLRPINSRITVERFLTSFCSKQSQDVKRVVSRRERVSATTTPTTPTTTLR
jgi:hypothetical protein